MTPAGYLERVPALSLCLGSIAGVLAMDLEGTGILLEAGIILSVLIFFFKYNRRSAWTFLAGAFITICIASVLGNYDADRNFYEGERQWRGEVESCRNSDRSGKYVVKIDSPAVLRCELLITSVTPSPRPGDIINFRGILERTDKLSGIPGWKNTDGYSKSELLSGRIVAGEHDVRIASHHDTFLSYLKNLRYDIADEIYRSGLKPSTGRLIAGSWLGGGDTGDDIRETFRATGLAHLLCVSGFHTAVLAAVLALLLFPLRWLPHGRIWFYGTISILIWCYAVMTGFQPSVVRAAVMISAYMFAKMSQREVNAINSLFLAVSLILYINPYWLFAVGFQLSVCAVGGILLFAKKLNPVPQRKRVPHKIVELFCVPISAMLGTLPVLLYHFHSVPLLSIPVNALASLFYPVMMIGGGVNVLMSHIGLPTGILDISVDFLADSLIRVCGNVVDTVNWRFLIPQFSLLNALLLSASIILAAAALYISGIKKKVTATCLALVCLIFCMPEVNDDHKVRILIHGNRSGTDIALSDGYEARLWTMNSNGKSCTDYTPFYSYHGVNEEVSANALEGSLEVNGRRIVKAGKGFRICESAPHILVVDRLYDGNPAQMLPEIRPEQVVVSPAVSSEMLASITEACGLLGIGLHNLSAKAYYAEW